MKNYSLDRKFLGTLITAENYKEIAKDPDKKRFHEKHIRAYKQGKDFFHHGWEVDEKGNRKPIIHEVKQTFIINYVNDKDESVHKEVGSQRMLQFFLK